MLAAIYDPYADFVSFQLPNGLKVWKLHMPGRPWEKVRIIVHTGHSSDPVGKEGLAHFCEHLAKAQHPTNPDELSKRFESFGGSASFGMTCPDETYYEFSIPLIAKGEDTLSWAYKAYRDLVSHPSTVDSSDIKDVEKERSIISSEFRRKFPMSWQYPELKRLRETLYSGMWQSRIINGLGSLNSLSALNVEDVVTLYRDSYSPSNMTIISVGGASTEDTQDIVRRYFGGLVPSKVNRFEVDVRRLVDVPLLPLSRKVVVKLPDMTTTDVEMWGLIPASTSTEVNGVFGDMLNDALSEDIREARHLSYQVSSSFYRFANVVERSMIARSIPPESTSIVEEAFRTALERVWKDDKLFARSVEYLIARKLMLDTNGTNLRSGAGDCITVFGRVTSTTEDLENLQRVTHDDIRSLVETWFTPERLHTRIFQPLSD